MTSIRIVLSLLTTLAVCSLHGQTDDTATIRAIEGKQTRIVSDFPRLLSLLDDPVRIKLYALVRIDQHLQDIPITPMPKTMPAAPSPSMFYAVPSIDGNYEFLNPLNPSKAIKSVPFSLPIQFGLMPGSETGRFTPYRSNLSVYAFCQFTADQLNAEKIVTYPKTTLLIPDTWVADCAKMLTAPNVTDFFKPVAAPPSDYHFTTKLSLLIYGYDLFNHDLTKFEVDFPKLLAGGDIYTGAFFTDQILDRAFIYTSDADRMVKESTFEISRGVKGAPTQADAANEVKEATNRYERSWKIVNDLIQNSAGKPEMIGPIALGLDYYSQHASHNDDVIIKLKQAIASLNKIAKSGAPEWADTNRMLEANKEDL